MCIASRSFLRNLMSGEKLIVGLHVVHVYEIQCLILVSVGDIDQP